MNSLNRQHLVFGVFAVGVALLNVGSLQALTELALADSTVSHVIVIPAVTLALVYSDRDIIFRTHRPSPLIGGAALLAAVTVAVLGRVVPDSPAASLTVMIASLVVSWIAGFVMFYGLASARAALFPLGFLALMIPMPSAVVDGATEFLKTGSTEAVASLFTLTGTPFHRQGFVFSLPSFVIEIADECSGIRSSIALMLTGVLAGHRFLQRPWTKIALVLLILPIAVIKNAIRIVTLSLLAMHVDPSFLTGQLHHEGGFVFFLLTLGLLAPLFALLRWSETSRSSASSAT